MTVSESGEYTLTLSARESHRTARCLACRTGTDPEGAVPSFRTNRASRLSSATDSDPTGHGIHPQVRNRNSV